MKLMEQMPPDLPCMNSYPKTDNKNCTTGSHTLSHC